MILTVIGVLRAISKGLVKGLGNKRISGDHRDYGIIKISQNSEKSQGQLRILAVTQTPVENYQLILE